VNDKTLRTRSRCTRRRFRKATAIRLPTGLFVNAIRSAAISTKMPTEPTGPKQTAAVAKTSSLDNPVQYEAKSVLAKQSDAGDSVPDVVVF
jgi:hypothetical protein